MRSASRNQFAHLARPLVADAQALDAGAAEGDIAGEKLDVNWACEGGSLGRQADRMRTDPPFAMIVARPHVEHADEIKRAGAVVHLDRDSGVERGDRGAGVNDSARLEHDDALGQPADVGLIVTDEQRRNLPRRERPFQIDEYSLFQILIEGGERFVHQQQRRASQNAAPQRDALLLAAAELSRVAIEQPAQFQDFDELVEVDGACLALALPEAEIVGDREMREEPMLLENNADVALFRRQKHFAGRVEQHGIGHCDSPGLRPEDSCDNGETSALAGARGTEDRGHATVGRELRLQLEAGGVTMSGAELKAGHGLTASPVRSGHGVRGIRRPPSQRPQ